MLRNIIRTRFLLPRVRPYQTENFYALLSRGEKEVTPIADKKKQKAASGKRSAADKRPKKAGPHTAQQTIPYRAVYKDGICRVNERLFTKSIEYEDINYQLAQADDQSAIFDGYCAFLNSFDSTLPFQLSFLNHRSRPESKYTINIPMQEDAYNGIRQEFVEMLEGQIAKSNNGIVRTKLLTLGVQADSLAAAKPRLERVEADICGNFKKLGYSPAPLPGWNVWKSFTASSTREAGSPSAFVGYDTKDRAFHQGLHRPGQLRLPAEPLFQGGANMGRSLLYADHGLGAFRQAPCRPSGSGCGNDRDPPHPDGRPSQGHQDH